MILDTNALSDFLAKNPQVRLLVEAAPLLTVPVIVLGEYQFGLRSSFKRVRLEFDLSELLRDTQVLDIDVQTVPNYADIRHELKSRGRPIPENDLWIAALARQHGLPVLTRDAHFDAVQGLKRLAW